MTIAPLDYKKKYKELYATGTEPVLVEVPHISFIAVDGTGSPQDEEYQKAIEVLYALSYTIKMSKKSADRPAGYFEYVVPPLEGFWSAGDNNAELDRKSEWAWTSVIRQPEFADRSVFEWAVRECRRKKPELDTSRARLEIFTEGLCVQALHIGPYAEEHVTIRKMERFVAENGLKPDYSYKRRHHEIYLSNPLKTAPEKIRTVLRIPVERL